MISGDAAIVPADGIAPAALTLRALKRAEKKIGAAKTDWRSDVPPYKTLVTFSIFLWRRAFGSVFVGLVYRFFSSLLMAVGGIVVALAK